MEVFLSEKTKIFITKEDKKLISQGRCCTEEFTLLKKMAKKSRDKGARGELELFALLSEHLGFVVRRNVDQARAGGADGIEIPGWAVEVKRRESLSVPAWWRQTVRQAQASGRKPILFYRRNGEKWKAVIEDCHNRSLGRLIDPKDPGVPLGRECSFYVAKECLLETLK